MSAIRPLPPRPSLEFERKEAKALLRQLRAGNVDAHQRARARHPLLAQKAPSSLQLADAQLVIAREYGFASWTRLVRYFEGMERVLRRTPCTGNPGLGRPEWYPRFVQQLVDEHERRIHSASAKLIAFVPRFYGLSPDEAFELDATEQDAQLAVARGEGFLSWDLLMSAVTARFDEVMQSKESETPRRRAYSAMRDADLAQLQLVVREHPELLTPSEDDIATSRHLLSTAIAIERTAHAKQRDPMRMRPIIDWLAQMGFDVQLELNLRLCGDSRTTAEDVEYWIERGANAKWIAPNGYSVLEHAIVRYWNPTSLDQLAKHATVRKPSLWIAAGLGDVAGVHGFLDATGRPTAAACEHRPEFDAIGPFMLGSSHGDDHADVMHEAAYLAFLNQRTAVMEYLVSRGFPIDEIPIDMPYVVMAVGENMVAMVETLVRCGANLDLRGTVNGSAREMARTMLLHQPDNADRRRIAELCGLDVQAILSAREARGSGDV